MDSRPQPLPRLPLEGKIDLTYRCNNDCRHCWLRIAPEAPEKKRELTAIEIRRIAEEARRLGCQEWSISGGEPLLRPDFPEIFEALTRTSIAYSLNTNGTLITPEIARLLRHKGRKMVALYGATAEVHDHITRTPGSFESMIRGLAYLKEAGAGFITQIVPLRDNYHQFKLMVELAGSLGGKARIGALWLYLSAGGNPAVNREISKQRLRPEEILEIDPPRIPSSEGPFGDEGRLSPAPGDRRFFATCIANRRDFHVDAYGGMSFCAFIKDPEFRYDLKTGTVDEAWHEFIPSRADKAAAADASATCLDCPDRSECRWCPAFSYLEHGDYGAPIASLCALTREENRRSENWRKNHRVFYRIGDIVLQIDSDLEITAETFHRDLAPFKVDGPGEDTVFIHHHFALPDLRQAVLDERVYSQAPWSIYRTKDSWIYLEVSPTEGEADTHRVAVFNRDHTRANVYHRSDSGYKKGGWTSLAMFPTDQILVARLLADRTGCLMHASGVVLDGRGLLFVGHSEAGKSTISTLLKSVGEILCDDRIIIRRRSDGFRIYGTWSHGDVADISPRSASLQAVFFLEKATVNDLERLRRKAEIMPGLLACLIKPLTTREWWEKQLDVLESIADHVPCYRMRFDKSGKIVPLLKSI